MYWLTDGNQSPGPAEASKMPARCRRSKAGSTVERMVSRNRDDDSIPNDLARGLEGIAAARKKSVEQLALERLRSLIDDASSPAVVLRAVRQLPHPSYSAVYDLDAAIAAARLPMCAMRASSTGGHRGDLSAGHKCDQRFDEGGTAN
jgi:hypothetical protein